VTRKLQQCINNQMIVPCSVVGSVPGNDITWASQTGTALSKQHMTLWTSLQVNCPIFWTLTQDHRRYAHTVSGLHWDEDN